MLPDRVSNPGPLTYESGVLPITLRGPAIPEEKNFFSKNKFFPLSIASLPEELLCSKFEDS